MGNDRSAPRISWDELLAATPEPVRAALPMIPWRLDRLWGLSLPVQRIGIGQFAWLLDLPLWQRDGIRFQVTPRQVLDGPDEFPDHFRRVMDSDLGYPIHVVRHRGRLVVLDGFHRLAKATIEKRHQVEAIVLSAADLEFVSHIE